MLPIIRCKNQPVVFLCCNSDECWLFLAGGAVLFSYQASPLISRSDWARARGATPPPTWQLGSSQYPGLQYSCANIEPERCEFLRSGFLLPGKASILAGYAECRPAVITARNWLSEAQPRPSLITGWSSGQSAGGWQTSSPLQMFLSSHCTW